MKLEDFKNPDKMIEIAKQLLTPKPLPFFKSKPRKQVGEVSYAGFTDRMLAMTVDVILMYVLLFSLFNWISSQVFPQTNPQAVIEQFSATILAMSTQKITVAQAWDSLLEAGIAQKMMFDYALQMVVTGVLVIFAWTKYAKTPGMMLFCMYVADADTGAKPSLKQSVLRYIGLILAFIPFSLGLIWIVFDKHNQGWQDKMANTVVLQKTSVWPWQKRKETDA